MTIVLFSIFTSNIIKKRNKKEKEKRKETDSTYVWRDVEATIIILIEEG